MEPMKPSVIAMNSLSRPYGLNVHWHTHCHDPGINWLVGVSFFEKCASHRFACNINFFNRLRGLNPESSYSVLG
jgi:hypothetical protein